MTEATNRLLLDVPSGSHQRDARQDRKRDDPAMEVRGVTQHWPAHEVSAFAQVSSFSDTLARRDRVEARLDLGD